MERSRSKRNNYYDQDYDSETLVRSTKPRYNHNYTNNNNSNSNVNQYRRGGGGGGGRPTKMPESPGVPMTSYRILCHDMKAGGVIGKSGCIIKAIRTQTGAWINVHELIPGDEERIIEISDNRRKDPDGRLPAFSPAQDALISIHGRIVESSDGVNGDDDEYGSRNGSNRVVTRLVVSRMHVGSLLGKGGKIIEQMRNETKTHIRVLPRDNNLPRCVSMSEEIVQVTGDIDAVKNAVAIISSRIKESQHRDRSHLHGGGRVHSPDQFFPPEDDFIPRRSPIDGDSYGSRPGFAQIRSNNYSTRPSGVDAHLSYGEGIVFRILCPVEKVDCVVGESNGIIDLLRDEVGVDITVTDPLANSDERIFTIYSEEGPDNELFPAQEALLHIQTCIVDLFPDKDNIITTKLLIPSNEIGSLSDIRSSGTRIHILPREQLPIAIMSGTDEILQITGEIKAARNAVVEVTARLRNYIYRELLPPLSPNSLIPARDVDIRNDQPVKTLESVPAIVATQSPKVSGIETQHLSEIDRREIVPRAPNRMAVPLVTRSILEVVLPEYAIPKLITKSKNKLAQISNLSGATIKVVEDGADGTEKTIQISGTPEQAERAQSLLQGFILSTQEDL